MAQKDENEVDSLFNKKGSEESSGDKGEQGKGEGSNQETPEVVEANGRKYDLSKPEDRKAMSEDYQNLNTVHSKQSSELGELRKQREEFQKVLNPEGTGKQNEDRGNEDQETKNKPNYVTRDELEAEKYNEQKTAAVNQFAQKYGLTVQDVMNEVDEANKNANARLNPQNIEDFYAARHPKEYREARQKMIRADLPGNHFTESSRREGMELPEEEVPQFGKNVTDKALELLNSEAVE